MLEIAAVRMVVTILQIKKVRQAEISDIGQFYYEPTKTTYVILIRTTYSSGGWVSDYEAQ